MLCFPAILLLRDANYETKRYTKLWRQQALRKTKQEQRKTYVGVTEHKGNKNKIQIKSNHT